LVFVNDHRGHEAVLSLFDEAIARFSSIFGEDGEMQAERVS
jgi:hypothetical protein